MYYAHTTNGPKADWQPIRQHLEAVSEHAARWANKFNAGTLGETAGLLHDLGKYALEFQKRLDGGAPVDHSTAGARMAKELHPAIGRILAYVIAGHHAGLADSDELTERLNDRRKIPSPDIEAFRSETPALPQLKWPAMQIGASTGLIVSLFTRMLFSCLVDADHTDAATWNQSVSSSPAPSLSQMQVDLHAYFKRFDDVPGTKVNHIRRQVLDQCRAAACKPRGMFSLTVPTGGGKSLSSLAFALQHALHHGMDRVIYAIPYTSIIEQNAATYREVFGAKAVLEHHSNVASHDADKNDEETPDFMKSSTENWDAPLVVTTNVQLFESLFACRPSQCRKLHNIVNSVIVLDEAQMLPVDLLLPSLAVIQELVVNYGCSVVLCTATQPAIRSFLAKDIAAIHEIISQPESLAHDLKRVRVEMIDEDLDDETLTKRLAACEQCLCIVNSRRHARELFERLAPFGDAWHLSTWMHAEHRSRVIDEIKNALSLGRPCRVISTSLIECGVDIDFPVVYRALAGLDSIAQAAGRCNREGRLDGLGEVFVFRPLAHASIGRVNRASGAMQAILSAGGDPMSLRAMTSYFEQFYQIESGGKRRLGKPLLDDIELGARDLEFDFRKIDKAFTMIDSATEMVVIPHGEAAGLVLAVREHRADRNVFRRLQRYGAQVYQNELDRLIAAGVVDRELQLSGLYVLTNTSLYNADTGLVTTDPSHVETNRTVV